MDSANWDKLKDSFNQAIDLPTNERAIFLKNFDKDFGIQLKNLIEAHENADGFIVEPAMVEIGLVDEADANIGKTIDSYKILEEIGQGGMGAVYLATHLGESFSQKVALKLIKRGMDTAAVLKRFVMERQILANLEHPNIARLLDVGTTEDGLPYFVMEYIEGLPVTKFCQAHQFSTEERLKLFRQICAAISYAHQNLVVHRDIKPSNILVTEDGSAKLLDFGIAKLLNPDLSADTAEATATMMRLLTPEYASPEQLRGANITTASDVYSLGVVLYELLSGQRPFKNENDSREEFIQAILTQEPLKPSECGMRNAERGFKNRTSATNENQNLQTDEQNKFHNSQSAIRNLKGDLDNIILKALCKEPERRYQTVQEFSEDIRRHLAHLPVTAQADSFSYRADKFIRRHRFGVAAGLLILFSLLTGITTTAWQARRANLEREKAERRFNESRKLSKFLMTDVFNALGLNSGTAQVQNDLTQNTLVYLDNLAKEESDDAVLLGELAAAYIKLGEVQRSNLNDNGAAMQSFKKAVELGRRRVALAPNDAALKRDLVSALFVMSELILILEGRARWFEVRNEIQNLQQEIVDVNPNSVQDLFGLARNYQSRGEMFDSLKRREEAKSDYQNALQLIGQAINLSKDSAQTPQEKINLSEKYIWQGEIYAGLEDWQNSAVSNRTAGEIAGAVWRENPALMQALRNTTSSHRRLAMALDKLGDYQGALAHYQYSLRLISEERVKNPASTSLKHGEAIFDIRVGSALQKTGETKQATEMVKRGLALEREFMAENNDRASSVHNAFETFGRAAEFFVTANQTEEAVAVYLEWAQNYEKLRGQKPLESNLVGGLANIYAAIGDVYAKFNQETKTVSAINRNELDDAIRYYQKSLGELRQIQNASTDIEDLIKAIEEKSAQCESRSEFTL